MKNAVDVAKEINKFMTAEGGVNLNDDTQQERLVKHLEPYQEEYKSSSLKYLYKMQADILSDLSQAKDDKETTYLNMKLKDVSEAIRWLEEDYGKEGCYDGMSKMQPEV